MSRFPQQIHDLEVQLAASAPQDRYTVSLHVPAAFLTFQGDVAFPLFASRIAANQLAITSRELERTTDSFTIEGTASHLAAWLAELREAAQQQVRFSTPVYGFLLGIRGIKSAVYTMADLADVDADMPDAHYIRARGAAIDMAEFRRMLWDMERDQNGYIGFYDQRQKTINQREKERQKAAQGTATQAPAAPKRRFLRGRKQKGAVSAETTAEGPAFGVIPDHRSIDGGAVTRAENAAAEWKKALSMGTVEWTVATEPAYMLTWQSTGPNVADVPSRYFDDENVYPVMRSEVKDPKLLLADTKPVNVYSAVTGNTCFRMIREADPHGGDLLRAELYERGKGGCWSYLSDASSELTVAASRTQPGIGKPALPEQAIG